MYIGGQWTEAASGQFFTTENPFFREPWAEIPRGDEVDARAAIAAATEAFESSDWARMTATERGRLIYRLGDLIAENVEDLLAVEVRDNGKRIKEVRGQIQRIPQWFHYFAGLADKVEGMVPPHNNPDILNVVQYEPIGVVVAFTPWNSPLSLATWKLAPALAAGNTIVLKPSEFTSASALELARLFEQAGFPPGVFNVVTGFGAEIGPALSSDARVAKITFTGGDVAGKAVYRQAAAALTDVALELGGKSPNIVFSDAHIDNAVNGAIGGIFAASGQTCVAGSRLLLQDDIHDAFVEKLVERASNVRMGDPADPATQMAPIATEAQFDKIMGHITDAKTEGAVCVLGGKAGEGPECGRGLFVEPTIFTGVTSDMRLAREEVFGPVLAVMKFSDEDEAVRMANDTEFGLAAGLWTNDLQRSIRMSRLLKAGSVWVNTYRTTSFLSPFGGYKKSGIGRENGSHAILEFMQEKSVWFSTAAEVPNPLDI